MKVAGLIFLVVLVSSCAGRIKPDPVIPAIKAGYPTLEMTACGKRWHGLGICSVEKGRDYNQINLKIQGYYKGTGRAFSQNCNLDYGFTYSESETIPIDIKGQATKNCFITITLSPEYPKQDNSALVVYSLRGHFALKVINQGDFWNGFTQKIVGNTWSNKVSFNMGGNTRDFRVIARGCKIRYDAIIRGVDGVLIVDLARAAQIGPLGRCVLEGLIIDGNSDRLFTAVLTRYVTALPNDQEWKDYRFLPLPIPSVKTGKKSIKIVADKGVSIIRLNDKFKIDNEGKLKGFDPEKENILTLITIKGRTLLGIWESQNQRWRWIR